MRRYGWIPLLFLAAALCAGCQKKETDVEKYAKEEEQIMKTMMEEMDKISDSESAELDFLYGMIPHHESAVEMANSYLKYAEDDAAFRTMAEEIARSQTEEIGRMQEMIRRIAKSGETDEQKAAAYRKEYRTMMSGHKEMHGSGGAKDLDTAFAQGMAMHHQMAVDMAEAIVTYANDREVVRFAEDVIEAQEAEIGTMQEFLDQNGGGQGHRH